MSLTFGSTRPSKSRLLTASLPIRAFDFSKPSREEEKRRKAAQSPGTNATPKTPPDLSDFVEQTVAFRLHDWQRQHLCPALERLRTEKGVRLLLHGPPQFGKSVITSQRLPAYLIGCDPTIRVGLACYNETHATGFGQVVRDLMASPEYRAIFPGALVEKDAKVRGWRKR